MAHTEWIFNTKNFHVELVCDIDQDYDVVADEFSDEIYEQLKSGALEVFLFAVKVYYKGQEVATTYLGGSIYADPAEFIDHRGMNKKGHGSYFSDMVREAVKEARIRLTADRPYIRKTS